MTTDFNITSVEAPLVNGDLQPLSEEAVSRVLQVFLDGRLSGDYFTGKEIIDELVTDDWGPPPRGLRIKLRKGAQVREIYIPYDGTDSIEIEADMRRALE